MGQSRPRHQPTSTCAQLTVRNLLILELTKSLDPRGPASHRSPVGSRLACQNPMAFEQNENPPGHDNIAPAGEIRDQPRFKLKRFTVAIMIALVLPASALFIEGLRTGRIELLWIAIAFVIVIGGAAAVVLWRIISSRSNPRPKFRM
jgi:hypothetical protein